MAKILLADDSTHAQRMGSKILAAEGHEVRTVSNGQAAVQSVEQSAPDLIVADVFMPGRNGYEVCHYVKSDERLRDIPVLLIIGAMEPYDAEQGRKAGANGLITKPLESSSLAAMVKDLLRQAPPKKAVVAEPRVPQPPVADAARVADQPPEAAAAQPAEETVGHEAPEKIVIPEEMSGQAVGMLAELLEAPVLPEATVASEPQVTSEPPPSMEEAPLSWMNEEPAPEPASVATDEVPLMWLEGPAEAPVAEPGIPEPASATAVAWVAEPVPVTPEDEMQFASMDADWVSLTKMVEQDVPDVASFNSGADQEASAPLDLALESASSEPALPTELQLESFDSLSDAMPGIAAMPLEPSSSREPVIAESEDHISSDSATGPVVLEPEPVESVFSAAPEAPLVAAAADVSSEPLIDAPSLDAPSLDAPAPDASASANPSTSASMEELVRQAVEDLLPEIVDQIVARVMQSLKN